MTLKGEQSPSISERLQGAGITEVVVIDNTFDEPTVSDVVEEDIDEFWAVVRSNEQLRQEMASMGIDTGEVEDVDARDEEAFAKLWGIRGDGSQIAKTARERLFGTFLGML